mgnify:CR=1 FL=1
MTSYKPYSVTLSLHQKQELANAYKKKSAITIRLSYDELAGSDQLMLTNTQIKRIKKAISMKKGVDLKISKTQIKHIVKRGGSLASVLMGLAPKIMPAITKHILPGLALGATSSIGSTAIDKMFGRGQKGGFLIPKEKLNQLSDYVNLFTKKQIQDFYNALQMGKELFIIPTAKQKGGAIGTLLASIGIPMLLSALSGKGLQIGPPRRSRPTKARGMQINPYDFAHRVYC